MGSSADRVAVVGSGIVGACAALELRRAGFDTTVVDRFRGPAGGSTRRSSSVIRCHYGEPAAVQFCRVNGGGDPGGVIAKHESTG